MIREGAAQGLRQPSFESSGSANRPSTSNDFEVEVLKYVFGLGNVCNASRQKAQKFAMPLFQSRDNRDLVWL